MSLENIMQNLSVIDKTHRRSGSDLALEFKEMTRRDAEIRINSSLEHLILTAPAHRKEMLEKQFEGYKILFKRYLDESSEIKWENIELLDNSEINPYNSLQDVDFNLAKEYLDKLVVIKLNGGLGTGMGCTGTKSLISVRSDLTFLDLNVQQIEALNQKFNCDIPLVLMNSFNTQEETVQVLRKYSNLKVSIETFQQSMYPRINRESLQPVGKRVHPETKDLKEHKGKPTGEDEAWYPPGHGDVYRSLINSGLLDKYLALGKKWVFISNIDNMGATVDLRILSFLMTSMAKPNYPEFVMEVTDKTRADVKGGTLIKYNGKMRLLEMAQVPKEYKDEFTTVRKFKIFNTNNLWINMDAIKRSVEEGELHMEVIVNPKTLENGTNVIQLEEAAGAAIKSFNNAIGINVPRDRFLPVKKTADLLLMMSNLYEMHKGSLVMSSKRSFPSVPLVKLGTHFNKVKEFLYRFSNIPDMLELDHLTVSGDVFFGRNVVLKGTVIIIANHGDRIDIPSGSIIDNKIVSGNLRILDH